MSTDPLNVSDAVRSELVPATGDGTHGQPPGGGAVGDAPGHAHARTTGRRQLQETAMRAFLDELHAAGGAAALSTPPRPCAATAWPVRHEAGTAIATRRQRGRFVYAALVAGGCALAVVLVLVLA